MAGSRHAGSFAGLIQRSVDAGRVFKRRKPTKDHHARWVGKLHAYRRLASGGVFSHEEILDMVRTLETAGIALVPYYEPGATSLDRLTSLATLE